MRRLLLVTAMLVAAGAAVVLLRSHLSHNAEELLAEVERDPRTLVEPGPLANGHRGVAELAACEACHDLAGDLDDARCLGCHKEVARRLATRQGHHGRDLRGACKTCHPEHTPALIHLDRDAFDHNRAVYPLEGAHTRVDCEKCHLDKAGSRQRTKFLDIPHARCLDCHKDPHQGQFEKTSCETCHTDRGFKGKNLLFSHASFKPFPLSGAHKQVACKDCHKPEGPKATFRGLSHDCEACHKDPHQGQFEKTSCETCHTDQGFKGKNLLFSHASFKRFPLDGAHKKVACEDCHKPRETGTRFRGLSHDCEVCHKDPHEKSLAPQRCKVCHVTRAWKGAALKFDHQTMGRFPLDPAHKELACGACHTSPVYRPTPVTCAGCHKEVAGFLAGRLGEAAPAAPSPHAGIVACRKCHDQKVRHQTAASYAARCARCHTEPYDALFLARRSLIADLTARAEKNLGKSPGSKARLARLARISAHNFPVAEKRLVALVHRSASK